MALEFATWLAEVDPLDEKDPGIRSPRWLAWLSQTFQERGAISRAKVEDLAAVELDRMSTEDLAKAKELLPVVIADARAAGVELDVRLLVSDQEGSRLLRVEVRCDPSRGYETDGIDLFIPIATDAELLAGLADQVQTFCAWDKYHNVIWPLCPDHQVRGHADLLADPAVWTCSAAGGHMIARIGELRASS